MLCSLTPIEPDRPGQVGPNQIGMRKVGPAQVDGSQVSLEQVGPAQVRARELRSGEVGPHQFWPRDGELPPVAIPIVCTVLKSG